MIKGNYLDKLCFYNYPVVKTKSDNNNKVTNLRKLKSMIIDYIYICKRETQGVQLPIYCAYGLVVYIFTDI